MVNISIIIPTYHRKESLLRLLASITKEHCREAEVIVVEQGDHNGRDFARFARQNKLRLRYLFQKTISTSKAKNRGARIAKGQYLIFYDDDIVLTPGALSHIPPKFRDTTIAGIAGRVINADGSGMPKRGRVGAISPLAFVTNNFASKVKQDVDTVIGCHALWRTSGFRRVRGFDEQFTGNAMREESDLSLRIKKLGYSILFDPTITVIHMREPHGGARKVDNRLFWYFHFFSNETYFFLKHKDHILFPLFLLTRLSYILRCMFGIGREVSVRSILTPIKGIFDGIQKFRLYRHIQNFQ